MSDVSIVCLKWGTKYSPDYVNKLYSMVKRNLTIPFDFYCFTDCDKGIDPWVKIRPLLDDNLKGWWGKVSYFKTPMADIEGIVLTLDLDMVIVDNIDCLFDVPGDFVIMKDKFPQNGNNSSVMLFEANTCGDIYDDLDLTNTEFNTGAIGDNTKAKYWGDQVWITEKRPQATNFPEKWIATYKWDCLDEKKQFKLDDGVKMIAFTGKPDPHEVPEVSKWWNTKKEQTMEYDIETWIKTAAIPTIAVQPNWLREHWLAHMVNKHGWQTGAELGVWRGRTFLHLLNTCPQLSLIGVDLWMPQPDNEGPETWEDWPHEQNEKMVRIHAKKFGERGTLYKSTTSDAVDLVEDNSLDFIFVDADHSSEAVRNDIIQWTPKVKDSGWIFGHDINWPTVKEIADDLLPGYVIGPDNAWGRKKIV